ncbi:MAG: sulfotransferase family protein [Candidatus Marinimicrobia bacterium]|nr:sulfotransferase family protein [Candidatus Neomarinimicrobiota bacterium]|tara:strand:+ start:65 stop:796 length:732 start_codon:yes stop_codon:yes gene_type:complete
MITKGIRIAMWSGPRNISTALMRSFENRPDTAVIDEPFYAHYLQCTGLEHPGRDKVLLSQSTDWNEIKTMLTGPIPERKTVWYQKHMAQHNLKGYDLTWTKYLTNCFLIREPTEVIHSYGKQFPINNEMLLGFIQQEELFKYIINQTNVLPPVLDAKDILLNPKKMLKKLCSAIGIQFDNKMLRWPPGKRKSDGIWAPYWYKQVEKSTGFKLYKKKKIRISDKQKFLLEKCSPAYEYLLQYKI